MIRVRDAKILRIWLRIYDDVAFVVHATTLTESHNRS
jgi:hypothetical protein